jgi:ABC-type sugar transport system substrate-binding protein
LNEQSVHGILLQDPFEMGKQGVLALVRSIRGEKVEPVISTGEYVATPANQQLDPIRRLLRPERS